MAVLGLLLLVASVVVGAEFVLSNTVDLDVEMFGYTITGGNVALMFLAGAACLLGIMLGFMITTAGVGRSRRIRSERKDEVTRSKRSAAQLQSALSETADENDRLRRELAEERLAQDTLGGVAVPPPSVTTEAARGGAKGQRLGAAR